MKQINLLLLLLITAASAQAQYFESLYGSISTPTTDILFDGHITSIGGQFGHLLIGADTNNNTIFNIFRTDSSGYTGTGPSFFQNRYVMSTLPSSLTYQPTKNLHSLEYADKSGYAVTGIYTASGTPCIFYQKIGPTGLPVGGAVGYKSWFGASSIKLCKTIESSSSPGNLYLMGTYSQFSNNKDGAIFIIKIDAVGTIIWAHLYASTKLYPQTGSTPIPYDITESPVANSIGHFDVVIVGAINDSVSPTAFTQNAFVLKVDNTTGNITTPVLTYGAHTSISPYGNVPHIFTCIKPTSNPFVDPAGGGYVIGGYAHRAKAGGGINYDYWCVAIDHLGVVKWSNLFDSGDQGEQGVDIVCRSLGTYEYYLAGNNTTFHNMTALKLNNTGNMIAHYQYGMPRYGFLWPSAWDKCVRMDIWEGSNPGISLFGCSEALNPPMFGSPSSEYDFFLAKSDFNGFSCVPDEVTTYQNPGPGALEDIDFNDGISPFFSLNLYCIFLDENLRYTPQICDPDGKPAKENSIVVNASSSAIVYPNPVAGSDREIKIDLNSQRDETACVTISNMVGQVLIKSSLVVKKGNNTLPIDISSLHFSSGVYNMTIQGQSFAKTAKFNVVSE